MPTLIVCGLNHKGSAIEKREQIAMPKHCLIPALRSLTALPGIEEAVILSTCNRTEIYTFVSSTDAGLKALKNYFAHAAGTHNSVVEPNLTAFDDDAILHLFSVAAGFDSVVIGEGQILNQVGEALRIAQQAGTSGPLLNKLFNLALHCGKRVRAETGIARKAVSVASAAVELAQQYGGLAESNKALIIGAGTMGTLCTKHLLNKSRTISLTVFNPSAGRLASLMEAVKHPNRFDTTTDTSSLKRLCEEADTIFVTSGATEFVLTEKQFQDVQGHKLVFDLSMPRNVDPVVGTKTGIKLFSVDDLHGVVQRNLEERQRLIANARPILSVVLQQYLHWQTTRMQPWLKKGEHREFASSTNRPVGVGI